ncbi:MazG family protein [Anaerosacchariphilus polymeriproducens]|uniref:MazG family protein n=1 Tax=Anaerosacchariphilus polymeriproducens TaxID=1812858 RepID=A0A371AY28_9FIRM|nr:MazG family protein [Anaerosacchariphilus polymeriproducens]RDU24484.1 MazG family protein [Anaerosacchariphilus polymeriproducens]
MKKKYSFEEFQDIMKQLRSEDGCPWDRVQTHETLKPCIIEEAAEVNAAIRILQKTGDSENLCEELGDVLLQVVMHSQIAQDAGEFTLDDVISMVSEKMIRRHPHVFGQVIAESTDQVLNNWEEIKKQEKKEQSWITSELRDIPVEFPALVRGQKVLKKAAGTYKVNKALEESVNNIKEKAKVLKNSEEVEAAIGEILMEIANIAQLSKLNAEMILRDKIDDFIEKYE